MNGLTKAITLVCSLAMFAVLFFPIWTIDLTAPQYPEGLTLKICANKLAGNVDVINGLNHYIGMRLLHAEDFIEFTVLPYIIIGFAVLGLLTFVLNRRKFFNAWFILFIIIAIVSMVDFYRWEYNYGHELNPDAPIKVPGMSYQPPLLGYKQLLNFSAYSIPDTGGWIFVGVGVLLAFTWLMNWRSSSKANKTTPVMQVAAIGLLMMFFSSCSHEPKAINFGKESCDFCKMTIMDGKFASECISTKGKLFKFDDPHCLITFLRNGGVWRNEVEDVYFSDFSKNNSWIKSQQVLLLKSENLHSPMGGNMAAFSSEADRNKMQQQVNGELLVWKDINPLK